jgi:glucoamylase
VHCPWRTHRNVQTRDTTLGVHVADLETLGLHPGDRVDFTLYWPEASRWEGADFVVCAE